MKDPILISNRLNQSDYSGAISTNKVLKNTYLLLAMTIAVSAATCWAGIALNVPSWIGLPLLLVSFALLFVINKKANTAAGLYLTFAFTAIMGASLSPLVGHYTKIPGGGILVAEALGLTSVIFIGLSAIAMTSKRDFSFMQNFLFMGLIILIIGGLANMFMQIPALHLALLCMSAFIMSGLILFDTQRIVRGGETNYILATVSLYLSFYNLFTTILQLLGIWNSDD